MPVQRGPDGKIIEEKTNRPAVHDKQTDRQDQLPQAPAGRQAAAGQGQWDSPTDVMGKGKGRRHAGKSGEGKTILAVGRRRQEEELSPEAQVDADNAMDDPVVGWLVIIGGPGKGKALNLGYGVNSLGRSETDRVKLDFGDKRISQSKHACITYDPRGRQFYLQHESGKNLTYLNDKPVLAPVELPGLSHINLGDTELRFVPLCGDNFDWQEYEEDEA